MDRERARWMGGPDERAGANMRRLGWTGEGRGGWGKDRADGRVGREGERRRTRTDNVVDWNCYVLEN